MIMPTCVPMAGIGRRKRSRDVTGILWAAGHLFLLLFWIRGTCSECLQNLTSNAGNFTSPNYPNNYPNNYTCSWHIQVAQNSTIELTFVDFNLENEANCSFDFVQVRQNDANGANVTDKLCGTAGKNLTLRSETSLWVFFSSDFIVNQFSGFKAMFRQIETLSAHIKNLTDNSGTFTSPGYPNNYPNNYNFSWLIHVAENSTVELIFVAFDLENEANCSYDFVQIRQNDANGSNVTDKLCGNAGKNLTIRSETSLWVYFSSDSIINEFSGFKALFRQIEKIKSSVRLVGGETGWQGRVQYYTGNNWVPVCGNGFNSQAASVVCKQLGMSPLNATYLVTEGISSAADNRWYQCAGSEGSLEQCPSGQRPCTLHHVSVTCQKCGANLSKAQGNISLSTYPNTNYYNNFDCEWTIRASANATVKLFFIDMSIEYSSDCYFDFLEIREKNSRGRLLARLCGEATPDPIVSNSSLYLRFHSDTHTTARGFLMTYNTSEMPVSPCASSPCAPTLLCLANGSSYECVCDRGSRCGASTPVCGENLLGSHGNFTSPNYPFTYPNNVDCEWTITVSYGFTVELTFLDLAVEPHSRCTYDYIEVRQNDSNGQLIHRYCGSSLQSPIISSVSLYVLFHSDQTSVDRGFKALYTIHDNQADVQADKVRLVNGETNISGRLERRVARSWIPVCGNGFDENDATVVCKELGLTYSGLTVSDSIIAADDRWFECTGSEDRLAQCVTIEYACTLNSVEITCSRSILVPVTITINVDVDTSDNNLSLQLQNRLTYYLVKKQNGVLAVTVNSVRRGSVIVDAVVKIKEDMRMDAVDSLVSDLKGLLDIPMQVNLVYGKSQFQVDGLFITKDTSACDVATRLKMCSFQSQQCVQSDGRISCRSDNSSTKLDLAVIVSVVCACAGALVVGLVVAFKCARLQRQKRKAKASRRPEIIATISNGKLANPEQKTTGEDAEFVFDHTGFTPSADPPLRSGEEIYATHDQFVGTAAEVYTRPEPYAGPAAEIYIRPEPSAPPVHEDVSSVPFSSAAAYGSPAPTLPNVLSEPSRAESQVAVDQHVPASALSSKESALTQPMTVPVTQHTETPPAAPASFQRNFFRSRQPASEDRNMHSAHSKVVNSAKKKPAGMPASAFRTKTKPGAPGSGQQRLSASSGLRRNITPGNETGSALALYPDLSTFYSSTDI